MPQNCQIIGVNSVTNIEPGKGVMPAPVVRNADWFENFIQARIGLRTPKSYQLMPEGIRTCMLCGFLFSLLVLYRIVANCRFARGRRAPERFSGWVADLFI
jgi:hypothetical protein